MVPQPVALGLMLCDYVIVEEGTSKVSLIGTFAKMEPGVYPFTPPPFVLFATLTGGTGKGILEVIVNRMKDVEEVFTQSAPVEFHDRFGRVRVILRIRDLTFPDSGDYEFSLLIDGEPVASTRLRLL